MRQGRRRRRQFRPPYVEVSGHEVTEVGDGMSVVGLCKLNDFDLIIMDIMMPKLDGFSACREIRKEKNAPIIVQPLNAGLQLDEGLEVRDVRHGPGHNVVLVDALADGQPGIALHLLEPLWPNRAY